MWIALKIGAFYAAPVLAVAVAVAGITILFLRVRRNAVGRLRAALLGMWTLLLPIAAVAVIWIVAEVSSFAAAPDRYGWDRGAALQFLAILVPFAAYVALPIVVLLLAFWLWLYFTWRPRGPSS